jgi:MYXO-CTERM domain-containing protein
MRARTLVIAGLCLPGVAHADLDVGPGQPHTTITSAVAAAAPGDVIRIHAGVYTEDLDLAKSGEPNGPITLQPAGDGAAEIHGQIALSGDFWEIRDLILVGPSGKDAVKLTGNDNRIVGVDLSGGDRDGIDGAGKNNEIRGSSIHDFDAGLNDAHCIVLNPGAEGWVIAENDLHDCSGDAIQLYSAGFARDILDTRIEGNSMYYTGAIERMENAVDVKNADGLEITGNRMWGFSQNKTMVFQKGPIHVRADCNVLYDGFTGVEFRAEDGGTVEDVIFTRNLMHDFSEYALKFDGTEGAQVHSNTFADVASDGLRIEGLGLGGGTVRNNLWVRTGSVDPGSFDADHNGFFDTGSVGITSPSDVQADPLLDADYHLAPGSPMIDAGADAGLPFAGSAPDIGMFELGLEACSGVLPGTGGAGGGAPSGGSGTGAQGGGGGSSAQGGDGTGGTGGQGGGGPGEEGGCACRAAGDTGSPGGAPAVLAAALAALLAGRRRIGIRAVFNGLARAPGTTTRRSRR